jgi:hypothetical protein
MNELGRKWERVLERQNYVFLDKQRYVMTVFTA